MAVAADPNKLFIRDEFHDDVPVLNKYFFPGFAFALGLAIPAFTRAANRQPFLSGIQRYVLSVGLCTGAAIWGQNRYERYCADREAVMRHYIELHPEDFPVPERVKIGDLFKPWTPIR